MSPHFIVAAGRFVNLALVTEVTWDECRETAVVYFLNTDPNARAEGPLYFHGEEAVELAAKLVALATMAERPSLEVCS